jgi:hypothetical protein
MFSAPGAVRSVVIPRQELIGKIKYQVLSREKIANIYTLLEHSTTVPPQILQDSMRK